MLKINKKVEYALMVLKFLENKDKLISTREICDHFKTPFDPTARVMQQMVNRGILKSVKGIKGGYSLQMSLDDLSYGNLVNTIEDNQTQENKCHTKHGPCEHLKHCNIITPVELLNHKLQHFLENLNVW